jgi:hypothetical protein
MTFTVATAFSDMALTGHVPASPDVLARKRVTLRGSAPCQAEPYSRRQPFTIRTETDFRDGKPS